MNSKQRRKDRKANNVSRKDLVSALEKLLNEKTIKRMNDPCPKFYEKCGHPRQEYEFRCFGDYHGCKYLKK